LSFIFYDITEFTIILEFGLIFEQNDTGLLAILYLCVIIQSTEHTE